MSTPVFVAYVGNPDFHDGFILSVSIGSDKVEVVVLGYSQRKYTVSFQEVSEIALNSPIDMELYALAEFQAEPPLRKFVFSNSDDDSPHFFYVTARDFSVVSH